MDFLRQHIDLILLAVGFTVWLVRLEGAVKASAKEVHRLWEVRKEDLANGDKLRMENNALLQELRRDVKDILIKIGQIEGGVK